MHIDPGNGVLLPFWAFSASKLRPAVAGRASKMAITWVSRVKMSGTSAPRIRNVRLSDLVRAKILPKMHIAPGNRDLLPFCAVFGLKTPPGSGRSGVPNGHNSG